MAHVMPEWADIITDKMLMFSVRPTRGALGSHEEDIKDVKVIFERIRDVFMGIRKKCCDLIATADLEDDDEVRIFGEEFLVLITPFIKQSEEWLKIAGEFGANELNIHIEDYTNFISTNK